MGIRPMRRGGLSDILGPVSNDRRTTKINPPFHIRPTPAGLLAVAAIAIAAPPASAAPACGTTWKPYSVGSWWSSDNWTDGVPNETTVACIPEWGSTYPREIDLNGTVEVAGLV